MRKRLLMTGLAALAVSGCAGEDENPFRPENTQIPATTPPARQKEIPPVSPTTDKLPSMELHAGEAVPPAPGR